MRRGIICLTMMYTGVSFNRLSACLEDHSQFSTILRLGICARISHESKRRVSWLGAGKDRRILGAIRWRIETTCEDWKAGIVENLTLLSILKLWVSGHECTARISRWESGSVTVFSSQCERCGALTDGTVGRRE